MIRFKPLEPTPDKIGYLWSRLEGLREKALSDDATIEQFVQGLATPGSTHFEVWEAGEVVGLISLFRIYPWSGHVHLTLFDKMLLPRVSRLTRFMKRVMEDQGIRILYAFVPETNEASTRLRQRMGWSADGVSRMSLIRDGKFLDKYIYSMTYEEVCHGITERADRAKGISAGPGDTGRDLPVSVGHAESGAGFVCEIPEGRSETIPTDLLDRQGEAQAWVLRRAGVWDDQWA